MSTEQHRDLAKLAERMGRTVDLACFRMTAWLAAASHPGLLPRDPAMLAAFYPLEWLDTGHTVAEYEAALEDEVLRRSGGTPAPLTYTEWRRWRVR